MNARSIRFRLTIWYAGLLTLLLAMFGGVIYFTLERFLERNLSDTLAKDAQTIGESWLRDVNQSPPGYVAAEIEEHFAPSITGRFVRLTRQADGSVGEVRAGLVALERTDVCGLSLYPPGPLSERQG